MSKGYGMGSEMRLMLAAAAVLLFTQAGHAADGTWNTDAGAGNLNWSTPGNWVGGEIADGVGATANITYNITASRTITIDGTGSTGSRTLGVLNIHDPDGTNSYTISRNNSNVLTFDNTGNAAAQINILNTTGAAGAYTLSTPIVLADSLAISNAGTRDLTLSGAISGTGSITKSGGGVLNLSGGNSFTGDITINAGGTLSISSDAALGARANRLALNSAVANIGGIVGGGRTGAITGSVTFNSGSHAAWAMDMAGTGSLTTAKTGGTYSTGYVYLSGKNSYSGGTTVSGSTNNGYLVIQSDANIGGNESALTFSGGHLSIAGTGIANLDAHAVNIVSGATVGLDIQNPGHSFMVSQSLAQGSGGLAKFGRGELVLTGASTYTGGTSLNGGVLKVDASQGGSLGVSNLTFRGGALYLLGKSTGTTTQTLGSVTVGAKTGKWEFLSNGGTLVVDSGSGEGTTLALGTLGTSNGALLGTANVRSGATLGIRTAGTGPVTLTTTTNKDAQGIYSGRVTFTTASGTDWATTASPATAYTLSAYSGYSDQTTGTLASGVSDTLNSRVSGSQAVGGAWTTNTLKITTTASGESLSLGTNALTLTSGGLLFTGAHDYAITGGSLAGGAGSLATTIGGTSPSPATSTELLLHHYGAGKLTVSSAIVNGTGNSNLIKTGDGTVVLAGTNSYLGTTFINGGVLSISADNNLGGGNGTLSGVNSSTSSTTVTSTAASLPAGFGWGSRFLGQSVTAVSGSAGNWTITLGGSAGTALSGGDASWASAAFGYVYLNGGTLQVTANTTLQESNSGGSAGVSTSNRILVLGSAGGTVDLTNNAVLSVPGGIQTWAYDSGAAPAGLTLTSSDNGNGVLSYSGAANFAGGVNINGGTLRLNHASSLGSAGLNTVTFGSTPGITSQKLQLNGQNATIAGLISASTYAVVENGNGSSASVMLTVNNGADNTFAGTMQNGSGTLSLTKIGSGKLTLTGSNTYTGATTVLGGTLAVNGSIAGPVTVNGGRLGGSGTLGAVTIASGGTLAAGNSVGTLTASSLTLAPDSQIEVEFGGSGNDLTIVTGLDGLVISGGAVSLLAESTRDLALLPADSYHLFRYAGTLGGDLANLTVANDNLSDNVSYAFVTSVDAGQTYVDLVVTIPEPMGLGLLGLATPLFLRRRRTMETR